MQGDTGPGAFATIVGALGKIETNNKETEVPPCLPQCLTSRNLRVKGLGLEVTNKEPQGIAARLPPNCELS